MQSRRILALALAVVGTIQVALSFIRLSSRGGGDAGSLPILFMGDGILFLVWAARMWQERG
jgi:hypothetical protein